MEKEITGYDLFGNPIMKDVILREKFVEPPFTVLDSKSGKRFTKTCLCSKR